MEEHRGAITLCLCFLCLTLLKHVYSASPNIYVRVFFVVTVSFIYDTIFFTFVMYFAQQSLYLFFTIFSSTYLQNRKAYTSKFVLVTLPARLT